MPPASPSSPRLPLLLLLLPLLRHGGAAEDAACAFRSGRENFVLDMEDSVKDGASLLAIRHVRSPEDCQRVCCGNPRCNLALLEPRDRGAAAAEGDKRTCVLFNCVHRNRFVCKFVNLPGYLSYIQESVFKRHLAGPRETGESALIKVS